MARLTAERLRDEARTAYPEDAEIMEHAARVVEAAEALLTKLYDRCGDDPVWKAEMDALDATLEGKEPRDDSHKET